MNELTAVVFSNSAVLLNCINNKQIADAEMGAKSKSAEKSGWTAARQRLTSLAHFCTCAYAALILYLCLSDEIIFFTWHPILLSIGWMFLMTEGVLAISKDNAVTNRLNHRLRLRSHWILLVAALALSITGFFVVFINKNRLNKTHFKSWHALLGLIGIIAAIPTALNGIPVLYSSTVKRFIKPKVLKFTHFATGTLTLIFGGLSLMLSVYTNWFQRHTQNNNFVFLYGLVCVGIAISWILVRPIKSCYKFIAKALGR